MFPAVHVQIAAHVGDFHQERQSVFGGASIRPDFRALRWNPAQAQRS